MHFAGGIYNATIPILDLCLKKSRSVRSHDYRELRNVFCPHENSAFSNSSGLKPVGEKRRPRDGLVWTEGLTIENKPLFSNSSGLVRTGPKAPKQTCFDAPRDF